METKDQIISRLQSEKDELMRQLEELINASRGLAISGLEGMAIINRLERENTELKAKVESLTVRQN